MNPRSFLLTVFLSITCTPIGFAEEESSAPSLNGPLAVAGIGGTVAAGAAAIAVADEIKVNKLESERASVKSLAEEAARKIDSEILTMKDRRLDITLGNSPAKQRMLDAKKAIADNESLRAGALARWQNLLYGEETKALREKHLAATGVDPDFLPPNQRPEELRARFEEAKKYKQIHEDATKRAAGLIQAYQDAKAELERATRAALANWDRLNGRRVKDLTRKSEVLAAADLPAEKLNELNKKLSPNRRVSLLLAGFTGAITASFAGAEYQSRQGSAVIESRDFSAKREPAQSGPKAPEHELIGVEAE